MDLETAASELYGLAPAEFTAARDARSAAARSNGDKQLAGAIKKLKRPVASAWLANLLVRERGEEVGRLLALGQGLRDAHQNLAGDRLRALSQQRHEVVSALVQEAGHLAGERGQAVSQAVARELQETLEAALSDPGAAEALRAGRLSAPLSYSGLGAPGTARGEPARRGEEGAGGRGALREAEAVLAAAERRRAHQEEELRRSEAERDRLSRRIVELSEHLAELRSERARAEEATGRLRLQLHEAAAEVDAAERGLRRARPSAGPDGPS